MLAVANEVYFPKDRVTHQKSIEPRLPPRWADTIENMQQTRLFAELWDFIVRIGRIASRPVRLATGVWILAALHAKGGPPNGKFPQQWHKGLPKFRPRGYVGQEADLRFELRAGLSLSMTSGSPKEFHFDNLVHTVVLKRYFDGVPFRSRIVNKLMIEQVAGQLADSDVAS